ncbi:MAG: pseudouridine synthase [Mariprofundaceae bacterium]|nr:pseudouridine synthase [Mariprofundaceae bacterium]
MKENTASSSTERINRFLVRCGIASRRESDRMIIAGRVRINGELLQQPGAQVGAADRVEVDGKVVQAKTEYSYYVYNKPRGMLCARKDSRDRPLIYDKLDVSPSVQSVGRLDMDSEGLLILTDDGAFTQALILPASKVSRTYRVRVAGHLELETLESLRRGGINMGRGDSSAPWDVLVDSETGGHSWLRVTLQRGRWREVRRTLEACQHPVRRLLRVQFGSLSLEPTLAPGEIRPLKAREVRALRHTVNTLPSS